MRLILTTMTIAIVAGALTGGSFLRLSTGSIQWPWLALGGVGLQFVTGGWVAVAALLLSFVLLLAFVFVNLRAPGFLLVLIGLALNFTVIAVNQGMPVTHSALIRSGQADTLEALATGSDAKHHLATPADALVFLGDVIPITPPMGQAISIGDLFIHSGGAWFVVAAMRAGRRSLPRPNPAEVTG
jgi:hypothetical protein